jgi:peptidyl-prolyl cis-trans isomerase C
VDYLLGNMNPKTAAQFNSERGRKELVRELINQELIYLDALDRNIEKDADFQSEFEKAKAGFIKQYAVSKLFRGIVIGEEELKSLYEADKSHFNTPESVKASHILIKTQEQAEEIQQGIEKGMAFEEAAQQYSECPSARNGGDLGYFTRGQMVPEFEETAFSMEMNEISTPVKTQFGYHLIRLTDRKPASSKAFEEVRDQLFQELSTQRQQEAYSQMVAELKGKYEVKTFI